MMPLLVKISIKIMKNLFAINITMFCNLLLNFFFAVTSPFINTDLHILHIKGHFLNSKVRQRKMLIYILLFIIFHLFFFLRKRNCKEGTFWEIEDIVKQWILKEIHKEKKIRHLLSINKNAKYFPKEEQKKLMKGDGDGPKVKSSSLFGYKYSISSILPVWEI